MEKYKYILRSFFLYIFGYLLILLSNATFAFQSFIISVFLISTLYSLTGFFWNKKNIYILLPIGLHFLFALTLVVKSNEPLSSTLLKIGMLFFTPVFFFGVSRFMKNKKLNYIAIGVFLLGINILASLTYSSYSFENGKDVISTNINTNNTYKTIESSLSNFGDSSNISLNIRNKVIVLDFWFVSCAPCRTLMPYFISLTDSYKKDTNIVFLSINNGKIDKYPKANKFLNDLNIDKTHFFYDNDGNLDKLLQTDKYPELIIINKHGKISYTRHGFNSDEELVFSKKMNKIIDDIVKQ